MRNAALLLLTQGPARPRMAGEPAASAQRPEPHTDTQRTVRGLAQGQRAPERHNSAPQTKRSLIFY